MKNSNAKGENFRLFHALLWYLVSYIRTKFLKVWSLVIFSFVCNIKKKVIIENGNTHLNPPTHQWKISNYKFIAHSIKWSVWQSMFNIVLLCIRLRSFIAYVVVIELNIPSSSNHKFASISGQHGECWHFVGSKIVPVDEHIQILNNFIPVSRPKSLWLDSFLLDSIWLLCDCVRSIDYCDFQLTPVLNRINDFATNYCVTNYLQMQQWFADPADYRKCMHSFSNIIINISRNLHHNTSAASASCLRS